MKVQPAIIAELVHIHGPLKGSIQEFADDCISIGRHPSCSIPFPPELTSISRKHAEIIREGNRYKLVDHSTNGTFLNGRKVVEEFLKDGDVLEFSAGGPKLSFLSRVAEQPVVPVSPAPPPVAPTASERKAPVQEIEPDIYAPPVVTPVAGLQRDAVPSQLHPLPEAPPVLAVEKASVPVVIQFGPSIRSFRELPIVIGSGGGSDFVIQHPGLQQQHLQILFSGGEYWIRDLTGQRLSSINGKLLDLQSPVRPGDLIRLSPNGPLLSFLGEGRFAEAADASDPPSPQLTDKGAEAQSPNGRQDEDSGGLWARLRRRF